MDLAGRKLSLKVGQSAGAHPVRNPERIPQGHSGGAAATPYLRLVALSDIQSGKDSL